MLLTLASLFRVSNVVFVRRNKNILKNDILVILKNQLINFYQMIIKYKNFYILL